MFSEDALWRYSRQLALPDVGPKGQERLAAARVAIVGAGGLGSPAALYLVAAGVGTLGIIDPDAVDLSNLHRQVLYRIADLGTAKAERARDHLSALNPDVQVQAHPVALTPANALELLGQYEIVIDGTDAFSTRYLVNDSCVLLSKPNIYASVLKFEGQLSVLALPDGPCYRCLFPEPPPAGSVPTCAQAGVLGVLPGLMGILQATEALKLILGVGVVARGRLLLVDALGLQFRSIKVRRDPRCPACGTREITTLGDYDAFCGAQQVEEVIGVRQLEPTELLAWRSEGVPHRLIDVREPWEHSIAAIEGASLVPLGTIGRAEIGGALQTPLVLYCHHGARSQAAAEFLRARGATAVFNLAGGIDRYSREADPSIPRY
jgi:adenylyltransferase/sulfurtransferase